MKKIHLFALLVFAAVLIPTGVFAKTYGAEFNSATKDPNGNLYTLVWIFDENSKSLTIEGKGDMPEMSSGAQPWAKYIKQIENLSVEDGVTAIGKRSFGGMSALKNVEIAPTVKYIRMRAFENCAALEEITIPGTVENIQDQSFLNCKALRKVVFEDGVGSIGCYMFGSCKALEDVYVYGENTTISRMRSNQDDGVWFRGITDFSNLTAHCRQGSDADKYFTEDIYTITNWANNTKGDEKEQSFPKKENSMTAGGYHLNVEYITE